MLKFFRKYNKQLLVAFMVGLMVVFVGGQALTNALRPNTNRVVAKTDLGDIDYTDQLYAKTSTDLLNQIGMNWRFPSAGASQPIELVDWILLTREAEQLHMVATPVSVRGWLREQGGLDLVNKIARRTRVKTERILQAISELQSIQLAAKAIAGAGAPSTAEVRRAGRDILDKVKVNVVVLPAPVFEKNEAQFSESEMKAQWASYKDTAKGKGLHFGYYVPITLSAQYVRIDRDKIAGEIGVANLEKKARRYYDENRTSDPAFQQPPSTAEREAAAEQGTEAPVGYLSWEEGKEYAIATVRKQLATDAAERIANWLLSYTAEGLMDMERSSDGYKQVPEQVAASYYYEKLLDHIPSSISFRDAMKVETTGLFTAADAGAVPGIGGAVYHPAGSLWKPFAMLAFRTQAVVAKVPEDAGSDRSDYIAPYQTCPYPLTDAQGNVYVFRIVSSRPAHPAESVDEVRDQVVADLRLLRGWQEAKTEAEDLRSCSSGTSMKEAFDTHGELTALKDAGLGAGYFSSPPVSRMNRYDVALDREVVINAGLGIGSVSQEMVNAWFDLEYAEDKIIVQELADRASVLVVEWVETDHARDDQFEDMRVQLVSDIANRRMRSAITDWLNPDNIRARHRFELVR